MTIENAIIQSIRKSKSRRLSVRDSISFSSDSTLTFTLWDTPIVVYSKKRNQLLLNNGNWSTRLSQGRMNLVLQELGLGYVTGKCDTRRTLAGTWTFHNANGKSWDFDNSLTLSNEELSK